MSEKRPKFLGAASVLLLVAGLLVWWVNALTNEDPLWFIRSFNAQADWITIYWEGDTHMLFPGDRGYETVMHAFSDGVGHWVGYENTVGLSNESLERLRSEEKFLELHYNDPVRVHTRHLYPEARNFFVPLSGTHANWRRVFAGLTDEPRIGALNISEENFEALLEAARRAAEQQPSGEG
jgi:hypothetical protein